MSKEKIYSVRFFGYLSQNSRLIIEFTKNVYGRRSIS